MIARGRRRANLALLVLLPLAFGTGWLAFATGAIGAAWIVTALHAAAGLAIVLLVPWKQLIVRRSFDRSGQWPAKVFGIVLGVLVVVSVAAGIVHSYTGRGLFFGLTAMQVHVGTAIAAVPVFVAHVVTRRPYLKRTDLSRRNVLRLGGLSVVAMATFVALEGVAKVVRLPGARRRATGSYEVGSDDLARMPRVSWLFDEVPSIDPASFSVRVVGRAVGVDELAGSDEVRAVIDCTGGWYAVQTWRGTRLDRLLTAGDRTIVVRSVTGYSRRFPGPEASSLWLATHVTGEPLDPGHGAPVRLVAPGRRGFWWVKWVASVEIEDGPSWWQPPFPLQ